MCVYFSRDVNEVGAVILIAFQVVICNQVLDLGLDHRRLSLEHRDIAHHVCLNSLETVLFLSLHDFHDMCLHDKSAFFFNARCLLLLLLAKLTRLLLSLLFRHEVDSD